MTHNDFYEEPGCAAWSENHFPRARPPSPAKRDPGGHITTTSDVATGVKRWPAAADDTARLPLLKVWHLLLRSQKVPLVKERDCLDKSSAQGREPDRREHLDLNTQCRPCLIRALHCFARCE